MHGLKQRTLELGNIGLAGIFQAKSHIVVYANRADVKGPGKNENHEQSKGRHNKRVGPSLHPDNLKITRIYLTRWQQLILIHRRMYRFGQIWAQHVRYESPIFIDPHKLTA